MNDFPSEIPRRMNLSGMAPSIDVRQRHATTITAAGLAELSCVDGLCSLISAVTARSAASPSVGLDHLAEKLTELLEAAKYADLR